MRKGLKRNSVLILSLLACLFVATSFACSKKGYDIGEFEAKFKENARSEYYLGNEVCLDDQIVRVNGTKAQVNVSWTSNISGTVQTKELFGYGMYFFPEQLGEYTLEYIVSFNGVEKSANKKITVVKKPPNEHIIQPEPEVYDDAENKLDGFDNVYKYSAIVKTADGIIDKIALSKTLTDLNGANIKDTVAYVGFTEGFSVGSTLAINFKGKNLPAIGLFLDDAPEGTKIGGVSNAGTGIIFSNCNHWSCDRLIGCGPYRMFNSDHNTGRRDSITYFGPEFPDSAEMGRNHLDANTNYRFELNLVYADETENKATINFKFFKVIGANKELITEFNLTSTLADVNYNSTAFAFYNGPRPEYGRIEFSYELYNLNAEMKVAGVSGAYSYKAETTVENGQVKSVTLKAAASDLLRNTDEDTVSYLGFESGLGAGKTLAIDFTGKNMPVIGMFLDNAPEGTVIGGLKDAGTGLVYMNCNAQRDLGRLVAYGPNRFLTSDGPTEGSHRDGLGHYEGAAGGSESSEFGYKNLVAGTDYRLEIKILSADVATHSAKYTITLYKIENGAAATVRSITRMCTLEGINYNSTKFAFYGLTRPEFGDITFSYELYDTAEV